MVLQADRYLYHEKKMLLNESVCKNNENIVLLIATR